jgi:hypothetical protein
MKYSEAKQGRCFIIRLHHPIVKKWLLSHGKGARAITLN